jgi:transcriptional regulator with XRE-family HTH domain
MSNPTLNDFVKPAFGLKGYLASALTNLDEPRKKEIFEAQDVIAEVCAAYGIELYQPRNVSDPVLHASLAPGSVFNTDRKRVLESDILVVMTHEPSFGAGQELEFARSALLPIVLIIPNGKAVSRMVLGIPSTLYNVSYTTLNELRTNLRQAISFLIPILLERKLTYSNYPSEGIGRNVKRFREQCQLKRDALAYAMGVTEEEIANIEESPDRLSNLSLLLLRKLALVLKISLPELVAPDYVATVADQLVDLLTSTAAPIPHQMRGHKLSEITPRDKRRIWIRILRKTIDELDREV